MSYTDVKTFFQAIATAEDWEFAHNIEHLSEKIGSGIKADDKLVMIMDEPRGKNLYNGNHYDIPAYGFWLMKKVKKGDYESEDTVFDLAKAGYYKVLGALEYQKENETGVFRNYDPSTVDWEKAGPETKSRLFGIYVSINTVDFPVIEQWNPFAELVGEGGAAIGEGGAAMELI